MRNLNFRVWDKHFKIMGGLVSIDFQEKWIIAKGFPVVKMKCKDDDDRWGISFGNAEIMQSTGYKDSDGMMIYEGDILTIDQNHGASFVSPVLWNEEWCCLMVEIPFGRCVSFLDKEHCEKVKIIGNIYENPKLLEKKE